MDSLAGALSALEPLVTRLCRQATEDLPAYERHTLLLAAHEKLRARELLKNQYIANELAGALLKHGAHPAMATLAAQLAVACYYSGRILAATPGDLITETRAAFRSTRAMTSAG